MSVMSTVVDIEEHRRVTDPVKLQIEQIASLCFATLYEKLPESARVVEEKTMTLSDKFQSLAAAAHEQSKQIENIVNTADKIILNGEEVAMSDFVDLFSRTLAGSMEHMLTTSKLAMAMVFDLENASKKLQALERLTNEIQVINRQTNLLALNAAIEAMRVGKGGESFTVVAKEVKVVSSRVNELSINIQQRVKDVIDGVDDVFATLNKIASTDMSDNLMAREQLEALMSSMIEQNTRFSAVLSENANGSALISQNIGSMIMDIQFQDRNSQFMENSCIILQAVEEMISALDLPHAQEEINRISHALLDEIKLNEFRDHLHRQLSAHDLIDDGIAPNRPCSAEDGDGVRDEEDIELF